MLAAAFIFLFFSAAVVIPIAVFYTMLFLFPSFPGVALFISALTTAMEIGGIVGFLRNQ